MQISCTYQKIVVILHAFSMVGHIVPAREGMIINREREGYMAFVFRLSTFY